jgi:1,2-phenylacetyl-CoA epoxidase catalytic subunit
MIESCVNGSVEVLQHRLRKMLMEERYHFLHGRSWLRSGIEGAPLVRAWQEALEFFGPPDGEAHELHRAGKLGMGPAEMKARLEEQLETQAPKVTIHWNVWDPLRRRSAEGAIDEHTFGMLRGLEEKKYAPPTASPKQAPV